MGVHSVGGAARRDVAVLRPQAQAHEEVREAQTITDVSSTPTPRPPTPTPPTPTPRATHPPHHPAQPSHRHLKLSVPETTRISNGKNAPRYVAATNASNTPVPGSKDGTAPPSLATEAPSSAPAIAAIIAPPTATPKPACPNPNVDAAVKGQAVEPEFPDSVRQQGGAGTAEVQVTLDANGTPVDVSIHKSSGFQALDRAALVAARGTAYTPQVVDCVRTSGEYIFKADFDGA